MKKKQYKVKVENGQIKPLEQIDQDLIKEGIVIFLDDDFIDIDTFTTGETKSKEQKIKALESVVGMLDDLPQEQQDLFDQEIKRKPFFKEK